MGSEHKNLLGLSAIPESNPIPEEQEALGLIKKPFLMKKKKKKKKQVQEAMAATKKAEEAKITSLKVEVIDDTALILQAVLPMPKSHLGPHAPSSSRSRRNQQGMKEEKNKKKKQHVKKKEKKEKKKTIKYSVTELKALRFVNCEGQKRLWEKVYWGIGPVVAKEYDDLAISNCPKKKMDRAPSALLGVGAARGRLNQMNVFEH